MIRAVNLILRLIGELTDLLARQNTAINDGNVESNRLREERDLRYTYDLVERIYERRRQETDSVIAALLGLIAVNVAFLVLFLDRLCTVGPLPTLCLVVSIALTVAGIIGEIGEEDVELLVYELASDPRAAITNRIGVLIEYSKTLAESARHKRLWAIGAVLVTILAVIYSFHVTFSQETPLLRYSGCPKTQDSQPTNIMGKKLGLPKDKTTHESVQRNPGPRSIGAKNRR